MQNFLFMNQIEQNEKITKSFLRLKYCGDNHNLVIISCSSCCLVDQIRVEACTDPCGLNWSDEAASITANDDQIRVETCTDPCGLNQSDEAASTAAGDNHNYQTRSATRILLDTPCFGTNFYGAQSAKYHHIIDWNNFKK